MKRMVLVAAALLCACTQPPADAGDARPSIEPVSLPMTDAAGNRMEVLTDAGGGRLCTSDSAWCVSLGDSDIQVAHGDATATLPLPEDAYEQRPWEQIVRIGREDASALVGLEVVDQQSYSGGGASAAQLRLYQIGDGVAHEVVRVPAGGAADIRACFDEDNETQRAGACSDMYSLVTRLSLDESVRSGAPRLVLETVAGTYPGRLSRSEDNTAAAAEHPLTQADLVWARDETCSYRRVYTLGQDGLYLPDQPLPACADYLEP